MVSRGTSRSGCPARAFGEGGHGSRPATRVLLAGMVVVALLVLRLGDTAAAPAQPSVPALRIVHASPETGALDVTVDGQRVAENLTYGAETAYLATAATSVRLLVTARGEPARAVLDTSVDLAAGGPFTLILTAPGSGAAALGALLLADDPPGFGPDRFRLRFVNASPGTAQATLATAEGGILVANIGFRAAGESVLEPGRFSLQALTSGSAGGPTAEAVLVADAGRTYTLLLVSQIGGVIPPTLLFLSDGRPRAAAIAAAGAGAKDVIVNETFTDPATGLLPAMAPPDSPLHYGYVEGEYFLRNWEVATRSLPIPGDHTNATIAVDARLVGPTTSRTVSVGCRFTSDATGNRGYRLRVEPGTGVFRLVREDGGRDTFLRSDRVSPAIHRGSQTNRLELTCAGSTITAAINGTVVASVQDSTYTTGPLVIGVGARSSGLTSEARFDNLVVTQR